MVHTSETLIAITNEKRELEGVVVRKDVIGAMTTDSDYEIIEPDKNNQEDDADE